MQSFRFYNKEDVLTLTKIRRFETKVGERVQLPGSKEQFEKVLKEVI